MTTEHLHDVLHEMEEGQGQEDTAARQALALLEEKLEELSALQRGEVGPEGQAPVEEVLSAVPQQLERLQTRLTQLEARVEHLDPLAQDLVSQVAASLLASERTLDSLEAA